jgi:DNA-directed RNA polymerase specialized sigma subunit
MNRTQQTLIDELEHAAEVGNVAWLNPLQRTVVVLRLGWDLQGYKSQAEVGEIMGYTQVHVSYLERGAKKALHAHDTSTMRRARRKAA